MRKRQAITVLFLMILLAFPVAGRRDETGVWGGKHARLEITVTGATIEFDCARGTISQKISANRSGRFVVNGVYVPEQGGPVRSNAQAVNVPVRFTGEIRGKSMTLTIKRRDTRNLIGIFTLRQGEEGELVKCR